MIAHRSRHADSSRGTFGLNSCCHIYGVAMQVSPVGNRIAKVDADAEAHGSIGRLVAIVDRNLLLHLHRTAHRPVNAVKHDEKGIATGLNDPAAVLIDRRVYQVPTECPQTIQRSCIVQTDQSRIAYHVQIGHGYQLPPIPRLLRLPKRSVNGQNRPL